MIISANEIKTKGVSMFDTLLDKFDELIINVRGKNKYVVLDIERYKELRANELDLAYIETIKELEEGHYVKQSAKEHIDELMKDLQAK